MHICDEVATVEQYFEARALLQKRLQRVVAEQYCRLHPARHAFERGHAVNQLFVHLRRDKVGCGEPLLSRMTHQVVLEHAAGIERQRLQACHKDEQREQGYAGFDGAQR